MTDCYNLVRERDRRKQAGNGLEGSENERARYKRSKLSTKSEPKKKVLKPELEILKRG
ncbi:hypothetical protein PGTUg99_032804 [Puccinia graminis f. sp. tritici]|uniref:Uncharacterized protein n=1 Tax=Puccinia graminis f. sp. tritici TaxID=56615 RepID=A0A5B0QRH9_PUCGR|nr:hypothetical protein PGTUg99_032804 [Puccinia graminis f. sp. tritici]